MMRLYWIEVRKLFSSTAVWAFVTLCVLLNISLLLNNSKGEYADFVALVSGETGTVLGQFFDEKLTQVQVKDHQKKYLSMLQLETYKMKDVFEGYQTEYIADSYIKARGLTGFLAGEMRKKYERLQKTVYKKAQEDESLSLYYASATYHRHRLLENTIGWLLIEEILLAILLTLLSTGYEHIHKTENIVYSTKIGRGILYFKILATVSFVLVSYMLLCLFTFGVYLAVNKYGSVWNSFVSSGFNFRLDIITGIRPFITWRSLTVRSFLLASVGISAGVIICFLLISLGTSLFIRNSYMGFLTILVVNAAFVAIPMYLPNSILKYSFVLSPVWLWLKQGLWFTDGDGDIFWPYFETLGLGCSMIILIAYCICGGIYFKKRDFS